MKMKLVGVYILIIFLLGGCAVNKWNAPPPDKTTLSLPISIEVSDQGLSKMALPVGIYQVKGTQLLVSGHQNDIGLWGAFGVLGVLASNEINARKGAEKVKTKEGLLDIEVKDQVDNAFKNLILTENFCDTFVFGNKEGNTSLEVTQNLLLNYVSDTEIVPYVVFKVDLNDAKKGTIWSLRYSSTTGTAKPLTGENGWLDNNAEPLINSFNKSIKEGVEVILKDIQSPMTRDENKKIIVQGSFPFCKAYAQLLGYQLGEDEDTLIFLPMIAHGGVTVLPKKAIFFRPSKSDDPIISEQVKELM